MNLELVWSARRLHPLQWLAEAGDTLVAASEKPLGPEQFVNVPVSQQQLNDSIAAFFPGGNFAPKKIDAPLAGTWTLPHGLGRIPMVQVFLLDGEAVISDFHVDATNIVVTWASPTQGYVLAF